MSTTRADIVTAAERVFDRRGFTAAGMDQLTAAANVSSRTLYKHLGSKSGLIAVVLETRRTRFFTAFDVETVAALFSSLASWTEAEGARGCLFLRAQGEGLAEDSSISSVVSTYRRELHDLVRRIVRLETGRDDDELAEQILVLFEGAVSASSYHGTRAIRAAASAAEALVSLARRGSTHAPNDNTPKESR
ncbi:TetR/AcrR family transcriptional regulator [Arthrobacter sp.]|uniref:TetR/AcrR family transcriptional regulator n=1 Tax=Arthrobacter sp. TaxID=1667 RepID=UPI00289F145A|nr:TetR/AcrR family transcriptional regulator [Arthrobacter sp.]